MEMKAFQGKLDAECGQEDMFRCDITNFSYKDYIASMEFPIFSLAKNKDLEIREYRRGNRMVRIIPSSVGAATVFDKDLLLYVASQLIEAKNQGRPISRTVVIDSCDFLVGTERGDGRASFERIVDLLNRLRSTTIQTNVETGGVMQTEGFGMIDSYKIISEKQRAEKRIGDRGKEVTRQISRVLQFTVTLSEWLYNGLVNYEVLTMDRGYFRLSRSIDRRLYEIARKHCGDQPYWKIDIDLLAAKLGTRISRAKFRDELRQAIRADVLPEYRIALDTSIKPDDVVFYTRNNAKLAMELVRKNANTWFTNLKRSDNTAKKQPAIGDV
jgi:plasmid replication initiation protein